VKNVPQQVHPFPPLRLGRVSIAPPHTPPEFHPQARRSLRQSLELRGIPACSSTDRIAARSIIPSAAAPLAHGTIRLASRMNAWGKATARVLHRQVGNRSSTGLQ